MAASLTATTNPGGWVELVAASDPDEFVTVTVSRLTSSGSRVVRDASAVDISSGSFSVDDYEVPQLESLSYVATFVDSEGASTSTAPVVVGGVVRTGDFLAGIGSPASGITVNVEGIPEQTWEINADTAKVLWRSDPVVVSFGRTYWSADLKLITLTDGDRIALERILMAGKVVMFAPRPGYGYEEVLYLTVGKVRCERPSTAGSEPARRWTLEVQRVEAPPSQFPTALGITWQERVDENATWLYWNVSALSWLDFAGLGA